MNIDWDLTLKVLSVVFTIVGALYHWRNYRFRTLLKADLEILKLYAEFGKDNIYYTAIKSHIEETIERVYPTEQNLINQLKRWILVGILSSLFGFLIIAALWLAGGFSWWFTPIFISSTYTFLRAISDYINIVVNKKKSKIEI